MADGMARPVLGRILLTIPLVLVNGAAVWGQGGWAYEHITNRGDYAILIAILFALAVECTGAYLAWEAHEARMADRAFVGLQLFSYAVGLFAGVLNYNHFADTNITQAWTFGVMSALSPWLWGVYSRAQNTERLDALGLVDARGVKLSMARKLLWPHRSWDVLRWAAWEGEKNPMRAVEGWEYDHHPEWLRGRRTRAAEIARLDVAPPVILPAVAAPDPAPALEPTPPVPAAPEQDRASAIPIRPARPLWTPAVGSSSADKPGASDNGQMSGRVDNGYQDPVPGLISNGRVSDAGPAGRTQDDSPAPRRNGQTTGSGASGALRAPDPDTNGPGDRLTDAEYKVIRDIARPLVLNQGAGRATILQLIAEQLDGRVVSPYWPRKIINELRKESA